MRFRRTAVSAAAVAALVAAALPGASSAATAAPATVAASATSLPSGWQPRPDDYPYTVTRKDLEIPMSDGTVLRGDAIVPAGPDGKAAAGRFPVIVTIVAYNKTATGGSDLAGGDPNALVRKGYVQLNVDARGTGSSGGTWTAFGSREAKDNGEIIAWAASPDRSWSDGDVGMRGPSYMGINQLFTAEQQPPALKAIFPQVPAGDVYRDVVASGGALDVGFIPLWLGLVTTTGLIPPTYSASDPSSALGVLLQHLMAGGTFTAPLLADATLGQSPAYDGPFYRLRSPLTHIDRVRVPTFLIGGEYDLFQRGTPMVYDALRSAGVPAKLIVGPWDHLQGSAGDGIVDAGYGSLADLQLRWFDHYVKGLPDPALDTDIPSFTYYEQGSGEWRTSNEYLDAGHRAVSFKLSGRSVPGNPGELTTGTTTPGTSTVYPVPVAGLCSRSSSQWTAGLPNAAWADNPCLSDTSANDRAGVVFQTPRLDQGFSFQGPLNARLYTSSNTGDGLLAVTVSDVAPNGTVTPLTSGWQVISHRKLDETRSRYLDGKLIQPFHPFTQASQRPAHPDKVVPVDVEVFPTGARIEPTHRLRVSVQAYDVPHLLVPAPGAAAALSTLKIHNSGQWPSELTVPAVDLQATEPGTTDPGNADPGPDPGNTDPGTTDPGIDPGTDGPDAERVGSTTRASLTKHHTTAGKHNRVRVSVRGAENLTGKVRIYVDGELIRTRGLRDGQALVRLPVQHRGKHRVKVRYLGDAKTLGSRDVVVWRVKRR